VRASNRLSAIRCDQLSECGDFAIETQGPFVLFLLFSTSGGPTISLGFVSTPFGARIAAWMKH